MFKSVSGPAVLFLFFAVGMTTVEAAEVELRLHSGRRIVGIVDAQTDESRLWIATSASGVVLKSHWRWSEVACVVYQDEELTVDEFRRQVADLKTVTPLPTTRFPARVHRHPPNLQVPDFTPPLAQHRLAAVQLSGAFANWDADAEVDGIRLHIMPTTKYGQPVPVNGHVTIQYVVHQVSSSQLPGREHLVTQWNRKITVRDFTPQGYISLLEFRSAVPSRERAVFVRAELLVRLSVPGQGVFESRLPLTPDMLPLNVSHIRNQ